MSEIQIRQFNEDDTDSVVELWSLAFPSEPHWNESHRLIKLKLTIQPELFFVATKQVSTNNNRVVGTTIAGFDGVRGWVHKVATHPEFLRQGVSRQLMTAAEQGLKRLGCTKLNLQVREGNDSAVAFYQSLGFELEPRTNLGKHLK